MADVTLTQVYDELKQIERQMVTKDDLAQLSETIEIGSNADTMRQLASSAKDIADGSTRPIRSVRDLLHELNNRD